MENFSLSDIKSVLGDGDGFGGVAGTITHVCASMVKLA